MLAIAAACGLAAQVIPISLPEERHGLSFTTPAMRWDEALPLGNGMLGALVWGDGKPLRISLDRADLWDLRRVPEFFSNEYTFATMKRWHEEGRVADLLRVYEEPYRRPAPTKIPAGRIELTISEPFRATRLSLRDAVASVKFGARGSIEMFVHATEPVGMLRSTLPPSVRLVPPPFSGGARNLAAGGIDAGDLAQLGYAAPVETHGAHWKAFTQQGAEGFQFAVYVAWSGREMAWSVASSFEGPDPLSLARGRTEAALRQGYQKTFESHLRWWSQYWRQSSVRLPNPVLERQWYLETYKFGAASRRGAPPISLQAVWTADEGKLPPWKGDYHHDLNTQLSYWPCYSGNHLEEGLAYLDWLWKTRGTAFAWTKRFYGLPGLNVPMTADLSGNQIGGWRQYTHSASTAAWLAHHFYLHWKFSGDREFLRERAYPYLRDAAVFVEAFTAGKVVNIKNIIAGRAMAEELQKAVISQKDLAGLDPAHAAYVYSQNQVSVMSEQLTALKEMATFADTISKAEDLYVPSAPPMSPLTTSYFTCWAFFDACAGPGSETIGTTILEVGAAFGMHPELLRLIRLMQDSRMGFYIHHGREGNVSILEDLVTTAVYRAIVPAGYRGRKNENWYVRLLPPPFQGGTEHVVFTTPYIVVHPDFADWLAYFRRTFPATAGFDDYERHMKYGPTRQYWNDYVFEAYVNHQSDAIYLAGLPDIPESRPHSEISERNGWKAPAFIKQS